MRKVPEGLEDLFDTLRSQGYADSDIYASLGIPYSENAQRAKNRFNTAANTAARAADTAGIAADIAEGAGNPKGKPKGKLFKPDGAFGKMSGGFSDFVSNIGNPQFDYAWKTKVDPITGQKSTGIQGWGKNLGGMYNIANAGIQGVKAAQGLQDMSDTRDNMEDLISDIRLGAGNSPTIMYDLNANQRDLLRELQRGDYDTTVNGDDIDLLGALGDTAMGALAGLPGGLPGAIIGGVGGLANSVIGDLNAGSDRRTAELEALYQAVLESEQYHNNMRKQRAYAGLY